MRRPLKHPLFVQAAGALQRAIDSALPGRLIFVTGLSGAGKTELRRWVMRTYTGPISRWGLGRIPAIALRATPSDQSHFHSKDFIARWLDQLDSPHVDWLDHEPGVSERFAQETEAAAKVMLSLNRVRATERQMRIGVERLSRARHLQAAFVDEAGSMTYSTRGKPPGDHMVSYMCLAEEIPVVLVLFGVPRMRALWSGNAEICRRSHFVFMHHYRREAIADFARLLATLGADLPVEKPSLLNDNIKLVYHATVGVFGELQGFLARANESRICDGRERIRVRDLEAAVYAKKELATLHEDAMEFEALTSPADLRPALAGKRR